MNKQYIHETLLKLYKQYDMELPVNCLRLLDRLNITYIPYSLLSNKKKEISLSISDYGFTTDKKIFYNDSMSEEEIVFTLAHELGHIVLKHKNTMPEIEEEADYFAKCILSAKNK